MRLLRKPEPTRAYIMGGRFGMPLVFLAWIVLPSLAEMFAVWHFHLFGL